MSPASPSTPAIVIAPDRSQQLSCTRAALARHLGVSRAWVTKVLRALPPDMASE